MAPITGYDSYISVCEKRCRDAKPQYKREYSVGFEVTRKRVIHIGVKYMPNGTLQQTVTKSPVVTTITPSTAILSVTPTQGISGTPASTQGFACTPATADLNKDGRVDNADGTILANCYNKSASVPGCQVADIDGSGKVGLEDMNCVLRGGQ